MTFDDNLNTDDIDFHKTKRGKGKNQPSAKRWSFFVIEGIIVLMAMVAGGRFLFSDNAEVSHLQATIDAQRAKSGPDNLFDQFPDDSEPLDLQATINAQNQSPSLSAEALFNRGMDEIENGLTADAMRSFDFAIELNPTYAEAYFERGNLRYDLDQYYYAATDYEHALDYDYGFPLLANFNLGLARFERGDYTQAITAFDAVIELDPDYGEAYYWRGRAYASSPATYQDGINDMLQSIEKGYDEHAYIYFWVAKAYADDEDYTSAIRYYNISITRSSDDCEEFACWIDYNNRGVSYYWLEDYDNAIKDYTSAIQANPDSYPLAFQNRGNAYEQLENLTLALSDWNTMFLLLEHEPLTRTLNKDTGILRDTIEFNDSQIHVEFEGEADETVTISMTVPDDSSLDAMLMLRDKNDNPLAYVATGDSLNRQLTDIILPNTGTYTIVVASDLAKSSGEFTLRIE